MFSLRIFGGEPSHIRRARNYLQEARMAMLEHTIAAEQYQASAKMYAARARRLEEEITQWEAHKNGVEVMQALPAEASAAKLVEAGRIEAAQPVLATGKPPVGIVRAAA